MISSAKELSEYLLATSATSSKRIAETFAAVDRKDFVPRGTPDPYADGPVPIGHGATISQPYTVAFMLDILNPQEGQQVLDIGSGSGWTTALLAQLVGPKGSVTALELVPELVEFGRKNLEKYDFGNAKITGAGTELGLPGKKFDRILVSAAAEKFPDELLDQLEDDGILVLPVGNSIWKAENGRREEHKGFAFVPLRT